MSRSWPTAAWPRLLMGATRPATAASQRRALTLATAMSGPPTMMCTHGLPLTWWSWALRKVYYYHVHKSGGTTLCAMAGASGLKVRLATNCLEKERKRSPDTGLVRRE